DARGPRALRPRPPGSGALHRAHEEGHGGLDGRHDLESLTRRTSVVGESHPHHPHRDRGVDAHLGGEGTKLRRWAGALLQSLKNWLQLGLFDAPAVTSSPSTRELVETRFLDLLRARGLKSITALRLTKNSRVM